MHNTIDSSDASGPLDLANIRSQLIRLEDTIIFQLIERAQFPLSQEIYTPGALKIPFIDLSFLDWTLGAQESLQSMICRYESPYEQPFFPNAILNPVIKPHRSAKILHPNNVDFNCILKKAYIEVLLPSICIDHELSDKYQEPENYASPVTGDVACLQSLSKRIHLGKYVAESKFRSEKELFTRLIKNNDREAIYAAITHEAVEKKVLARLYAKAKAYGADTFMETSSQVTQSKINADAVVSLYKNIVIPLTKEVEIEYLMQRLD